MPGTDLDLLVGAARRAADTAMAFWRRDPRVWDKADGTPVSEADLAVDGVLRDVLTGARPDAAWLSEEADDDPARLTAREVFIVDPIDGTRAFLDGRPHWAHSVALCREARIVAAIVHLPAEDVVYAATLGGGATRNGRPIAASGASRPEGARLLAPKAALRSEHWRGDAPGFDRHFRSALAWRLCLVAEGAFDAMLALKDCHEWDIAAGSLIAAEAGATVTDREGRPLSFNSAPPTRPGCLAAAPALHAETLSRLAAAA